MNENLITALEAAWELNPVLLEKKLWETVEKVSKAKSESLENRAVSDFDS